MLPTLLYEKRETKESPSSKNKAPTAHVCVEIKNKAVTNGYSSSSMLQHASTWLGCGEREREGEV